MDVTLPNGRIIRGVPEGTPKEVIQQKAIAAGLAKAEDFPPSTQFDQMSADADRRTAYGAVADQPGGFEAALIGMGKGFADVGRGVGLMDPETEGERLAMESLRERRPYSTGAGEIAGQALPFVAPGLGVANVASLPARVGLSAGLGGVEGGVISAGTGQDVVQGAGIGAVVGGTIEALFPIISRIGRGFIQRVTGATPRGAIIDNAGRPTPEFQQILDQTGTSYEDMVRTAQQYAAEARPGSDPQQVARGALFAGEGVPISQGELTKDFAQQATEQRLLQSAADQSAEPFRQFKLRQSNAIRSRLEEGLDLSIIPEDSGIAVVEALTGRRKLLRTRKNELYQEFADKSQNISGIPVMVDVSDAVPTPLKFKGLDRTSGGKVSDAELSLMEYGLIEPTPEMIEAGFTPDILSIANHDDLLQTLKGLSRADQTGATSAYTAPFIEAIEREVDNVAQSVDGMGIPDEVLAPLREARKTTAQMKREFNPKALVGRLTDKKRGSDNPIIEASRVYSTLTQKGQPVENVRRTVDSLLKAGDDGKDGLFRLQTTTMLDLIDAGFGTKSRQIDGVQVFNPIAFRKRIESIGSDKLAAIFKNNPAMLNRIKTFEKIATEITADNATVPKGSAAVLGDIMNRLGLLVVNTKIPGAGVVVESLQRLSEAGGNRRAVQEAINASPDVARIAGMIDQTMPGLASAFGIVGLSEYKQQENTSNQNQ